MPKKDQFCLRNVPEELWIRLKNAAFERQEKLSPYIVSLLDSATQDDAQLNLFPQRPVHRPAVDFALPFKFIDLFAGIGGFRLGLQSLGGQCVFTSEWDRFSARTYEAWFGELPKGDINEIDPEEIPDHDVLAAGFPCQPFSIAGVSKKRSLGQAHGFECERQGNLFFRICEIVAVKRPPVLILENVKNLKSHDRRKTWQVIHSTLTDELGYVVRDQIIDAAHWVPQHRERIFIVCFDRQVFGDSPKFKFPEPPNGEKPKFKDILQEVVPDKYILSDHLWGYLQEYAKKHKAKGNGFGFGLTDLDGVSRTLSARYYKDGSEVLIPRGKGQNPRRLTPVEAAHLMGFAEVVHDMNDIHVSDTQAYRQFGNAVVPAVVAAVAREVILAMVACNEVRGNGCLLKGRFRPRKGKPLVSVK